MLILVSPDPAQSRPVTDVLRLLYIPGEAQAARDDQQPPARIELAGLDAKPCRAGIGVMVAMPVLAKCQQTDEANIVSLNRNAIDRPTLVTAAMGEMTDEPMARE